VTRTVIVPFSPEFSNAIHPRNARRECPQRPQKQELISHITDVVASFYGEHMRSNIWVVIEEIRSGQFGAGGHGFTTEEMRALIAGEPALKT
jgi:4-oxalocrotonate tautomerase